MKDGGLVCYRIHSTLVAASYNLQWANSICRAAVAEKQVVPCAKPSRVAATRVPYGAWQSGRHEATRSRGMRYMIDSRLGSWGKRDVSRGFCASFEDVRVARRGQQRLTELRHLCDTTVSDERPKDGGMVTLRAISSRVSGIRDLARSIPRPSSPPI